MAGQVHPGSPPAPGRRLRDHATTIFAEMTALAVATGSINLGQGFPDTDGPAEILDAARAAIAAGHNQYPPGPGLPDLRRAVAEHRRSRYGLVHDPDDEVVVTTGATEAVAAALIGLTTPGDGVVMFEPFYDSYAAAAQMAGLDGAMVRLRAPDWRFDAEELAGAVGPRTRLLLLNTPHNPTGKVFSRDELETVATLCRRHNLICVTDEVYEHLVYDGEHVPIASLPGMAERTVSISSAGKTFSVTGWKVGWACGPAPLVAAVRAAKQFLTFSSGAPFQVAVAAALADAGRLVEPLRRSLAERRDLLCDGLRDLGFAVLRPQATFFATTDITPLGETDGVAFCRALPSRCGVVAVPTAVFTREPGDTLPLVRWAFCKRPEVLSEALRRLTALRAP